MSGAVFLSYAREDTAAAQRIAEALRSHGVEVWFDQSELRGGDAWDQKIRKQVKECSLFVPVISSHTQDRHEGYFRLEWKLAVDRTHLMLDGVPFLAPVVIDDTPDSGAAVPGEFLRVQWTRLPGALPTPQFVEQVKRLLAAPPKPLAVPEAGTGIQPPAPLRRSTFPRWAAVVLGAGVLAIVAYLALRPSAKETAASPPAVAPAVAQATPAVSDKSIAVLPFENMSAEKDNAYFCDGVQEDIAPTTSHLHYKGRSN